MQAHSADVPLAGQRRTKRKLILARLSIQSMSRVNSPVESDLPRSRSLNDKLLMRPVGGGYVNDEMVIKVLKLPDRQPRSRNQVKILRPVLNGRSVVVDGSYGISTT